MSIEAWMMKHDNFGEPIKTRVFVGPFVAGRIQASVGGLADMFDYPWFANDDAWAVSDDNPIRAHLIARIIAGEATP